MGDPLSVTASVIAVLQVVGTVVSYLKAIKDGPEHRKRILSEVLAIEAFLSILKQRAESADRHDWVQTLTSLNMPNGPLDQFRQTLEHLKSKLQPTGSTNKTLKALTWPFSGREMIDLVSMLDRQSSLFKLALQNDHMYIGSLLSLDSPQ